VPKALGLGLVWGWLPCGLVYSVLLIAATSAQPIQGAFVIIAFGLGTLPAMRLTGQGQQEFQPSCVGVKHDWAWGCRSLRSVH
jgi:hypothetical protein